MGFYQNTCKPEGLGGKLMTQLMNGGHHAKLAEWGFSFLTVPANANILDAGCGGGANLAPIARDIINSYFSSASTSATIVGENTLLP